MHRCDSDGAPVGAEGAEGAWGSYSVLHNRSPHVVDALGTAPPHPPAVTMQRNSFNQADASARARQRNSSGRGVERTKTTHRDDDGGTSDAAKPFRNVQYWACRRQCTSWIPVNAAGEGQTRARSCLCVCVCVCACAPLHQCLSVPLRGCASWCVRVKLTCEGTRVWARTASAGRSTAMESGGMMRRREQKGQPDTLHTHIHM